MEIKKTIIDYKKYVQLKSIVKIRDNKMGQTNGSIRIENNGLDQSF